MNLNSLSIDRIDTEKGYTRDNIVLVSSIVNSMKNDLSEIEFFKVVDKIYHNRCLNSKSKNF